MKLQDIKPDSELIELFLSKALKVKSVFFVAKPLQEQEEIVLQTLYGIGKHPECTNTFVCVYYTIYSGSQSYSLKYSFLLQYCFITSE